MNKIQILETIVKETETETNELREALSMPHGCYLEGKLAGMRYVLALMKSLEITENKS